MSSTYPIETTAAILDVAQALKRIGGYEKHGLVGSGSSPKKIARDEYDTVSFLKPSRSEFMDSVPIAASVERTATGYKIIVNDSRKIDIERLKAELQAA